MRLSNISFKCVAKLATLIQKYEISVHMSRPRILSWQITSLKMISDLVRNILKLHVDYNLYRPVISMITRQT